MEDRAQYWMLVAQDSLEAARGLKPDHPRSSVSRAYYAAFAAVHAALLRMGERPREVEGTWTHTALPDVFQATVGRGTAMMPRRDAQYLRECLVMCRNAREDADCIPERTVEVRRATQIVQRSGQLVRWAEEVLG